MKTAIEIVISSSLKWWSLTIFKNLKPLQKTKHEYKRIRGFKLYFKRLCLK